MDSGELNSFLEIGKNSLILVVDDDEFTQRAVRKLLEEHYSAVAAGSGEECIGYLTRGRRPDLVLLDLQMPGMDGFETLARIRGEGFEELPVIFLTGERDAKVQVEGLKAGAIDYIEKPAHPLILRQRVARALELDASRRYLKREIERQCERIESLSAQIAHLKDEQLDLLRSAMTDPLTGISNRQGLRVAFDGMMGGDGAGPYVLVVLDMDHFKRVNDTYGHLVGDRYIKELADTLISIPGAMAFRFGGDEFCLLFSRASRDEVVAECERVQRAFRASGVCREIEELTLSFGVAEWDGRMAPPDLLERADIALYMAKETRACVRCYDG